MTEKEKREREEREQHVGWVNPNGKTTPKNVRDKKSTSTSSKTRGVLEKAFVGNTIKAAPPSKEEQERLRKQGSRSAANQYSKSYSGPANNYSRSNSGRGR